MTDQFETDSDAGTDPAAALRLVRETRRAAVLRAKAPAWYHPVLGLVFLLIFTALEFENGVIFICFAMSLLALAVSQHQQKSGTWQNGFTVGGRRSKRLAGLMLIVTVAMLAGGAFLKHRLGMDGAMIGMGVVAALFVTWSGYAWERAFLRDAEEGL